MRMAWAGVWKGGVIQMRTSARFMLEWYGYGMSVPTCAWLVTNSDNFFPIRLKFVETKMKNSMPPIDRSHPVLSVTLKH